MAVTKTVSLVFLFFTVYHICFPFILVSLTQLCLFYVLNSCVTSFHDTNCLAKPLLSSLECSSFCLTTCISLQCAKHWSMSLPCLCLVILLTPAAQLAVLLGQNPSLGLHPVFSSLMTSLPLATGQLPAHMAAAAMSPLDLSQNPAAAGTSGAATSQYHIQDAEFKPNDAAAMQAAVLAMGGVSGMQQVVHKKKKKHKVKTEGGEQVDPEAAERRRKRKLVSRKS